MVKLRGGLPKDAPEIAGLIMEAMTLECCAFFLGPDNGMDDFRALMSELCLRNDTQYSYLNSVVAVEGDKIVGVAVSYDGGRLHELRRAFVEGASCKFCRDFSHIGDETECGELYLDSLAVKRMYRHCGIGGKLMDATLKKAERIGLGKVGLLVDDNNPNAESLYRKKGFEYVNASSWAGHGMKHFQHSV